MKLWNNVRIGVIGIMFLVVIVKMFDPTLPMRFYPPLVFAAGIMAFMLFIELHRIWVNQRILRTFKGAIRRKS